MNYPYTILTWDIKTRMRTAKTYRLVASHYMGDVERNHYKLERLGKDAMGADKWVPMNIDEHHENVIYALDKYIQKLKK
jgi:hypothetical protein